MIKLFLCLVSVPVSAQLLMTGETIGRNKAMVFFSPSLVWAVNSPKSTFSFGQVMYGLNNRVDIAFGVSLSTVLGQRQFGVIAGTNVNMLKTKVLSLSTWQNFGTGLHHRKESCDIWWYPSLVISRNFKNITVYGGYAVTIPIGNIKDKLFTSNDVIHDIPMGISWTKGKSSLFSEYNYGPKYSVIAIGYGYQFK